jgi:hypothetical protein
MGSARGSRAQSGGPPDSRSSHPSSGQGDQSDEVFGGPPKTAREPRALPEHLRTLIHALRGNLDCIVMKCVEKDRSRRYETANGLADDIKRHLNNEPGVARPPSTAYRVQKLVRRNKLAFAAATDLLAALVVGASLAVWQAVVTTRAGRAARAHRQSGPTEVAGRALTRVNFSRRADGRIQHSPADGW